MLFWGNAQAYKPDKVYSKLPSDFGIKFDSTNIQIGSNGQYIKSWLLYPLEEKSDTKTILIVGTDGGNMSNYLYYAFNFINSGYRVIMFDYRGFGSSSSFEYDSTKLFVGETIIDFHAALDYWSKQYKDITLFGLSFGTLAIQKGLNSYSQKEKIKTIIFDSPILNECEFIEKVRTRKPFIIASAENCIYDLQGKKLLIILGSDDALCSHINLAEFNIKHRNASSIILPAGHLEIAGKFSSFFFRSIDGFLNGEI